MTLFHVDEDKCNLDGLCAADCPAGCIVFEKGQLPRPHEKKYAYCLNCGHCVAICPTGAIELERLPETGTSVNRELGLSFDQAEQFLSARRSVRFFKDKPVDRSLLEKLLALAEYAPSGHNARPTRWTIAQDAESVAKVAEATVAWMRREVEAESPLAAKLHLAGIVRVFEQGVDMVCRHASVLAVAHGPLQGVTPMQDGVIATTYLELAATAAGLGACWCGYVTAAATHDQGVRDALGVEEGRCVYGALMIGHPARRYGTIPPRPRPGVTWI